MAGVDLFIKSELIRMFRCMQHFGLVTLSIIVSSVCMQIKVITAFLTLSLAAASALPYDHEWRPHDHYWNQVSSERVARSQATQDRSTCVAVTESNNGKDYSVWVCPADEEG